MVALARRGLAFLVIAACAASALAAEEAGGSESFIAIGLEKSPRPEGSHPARLGVKPILGGAAIGTALLAAIVYFGLKVLGTKIVEVDAKVSDAEAFAVPPEITDGDSFSLTLIESSVLRLCNIRLLLLQEAGNRLAEEVLNLTCELEGSDLRQE